MNTLAEATLDKKSLRHLALLAIKTVSWFKKKKAKNLTVGCSEWENAVHEDDHYWCSSALHLGPFLFSILINSVGTKSRRALAGVPEDIREA